MWPRPSLRPCHAAVTSRTTICSTPRRHGEAPQSGGNCRANRNAPLNATAVARRALPLPATLTPTPRVRGRPSPWHTSAPRCFCCLTDKTQGGEDEGRGRRKSTASLRCLPHPIPRRSFFVFRASPSLSTPPPRPPPFAPAPSPSRCCQPCHAAAAAAETRSVLIYRSRGVFIRSPPLPSCVPSFSLSFRCPSRSSSPPPSPVPGYPAPLCDFGHRPPILPFTLPSPTLSSPPLRS